MPSPTRYILTLRPMPTCRVPDVVALRRLLKALGRQYALECVEAREAPDPTDQRIYAGKAGKG